MTIEIINDDAFNVLKKLNPNSVNLVILDTPYLVTQVPEIKLENMDAFQRKIDYSELLQLLFNIMSNNSVITIFGHLTFQVEIWNIFKAAGFEYVTDLIWVKPNVVNFLKAKEKPMSKHEIITVWKKGKLRYNFEEAKTEGTAYAIKHTNTDSKKGSMYSNRVKDIGIRRNTGRYMSDVLYACNKPAMPNMRGLHILHRNL